MRYQDAPYWQELGRNPPEHHILMEKYIDIDFHVRQSDIDLGVRNDCDKCPLALALYRFLGEDFEEIEVYPNAAKIGTHAWKTDQWALRVFSTELREWINKFDRRWHVKPIVCRFTRLNPNDPDPMLIIRSG